MNKSQVASKLFRIPLQTEEINFSYTAIAYLLIIWYRQCSLKWALNVFWLLYQDWEQEQLHFNELKT